MRTCPHAHAQAGAGSGGNHAAVAAADHITEKVRERAFAPQLHQAEQECQCPQHTQQPVWWIRTFQDVGASTPALARKSLY